jgi:transposase
MEGKVTLSKKEAKRVNILNEVEKGVISGKQAATIMDISLRHTRRLLAAYRKEGIAALAHGNRGRKPPTTIKEDLRQRVLELAGSKYIGFNHQHFTELLTEREDIFLSRSSVRNILLGSGIRSPRKRRPPKHRSRRERYPKEGMLLQVDSSPHNWLEGRGPELSLIGAIDDATNKVPYAFFQKREDSHGYIRMLKEIVLSKGIPGAIYHDRHSIFEVSPDKSLSLEEQLEAKRPLTQFGRLMEELGITSISANSPQAKGRIERLWSTFQDRLVSELRLAGAKTVEEANKVLADFLPRYNLKFAFMAREPELAYRKPPEDFKPDEVFCFKYHRTVGADNVVPFIEYRLQVLPSEYRLSYARCKVEIQRRLDGSLAVYYHGQRLDTVPAPFEPAKLREFVLAGSTTQHHCTKPAPDHPWRGKFRVFTDKGNGW